MIWTWLPQPFATQPQPTTETSEHQQHRLMATTWVGDAYGGLNLCTIQTQSRYDILEDSGDEEESELGKPSRPIDMTIGTDIEAAIARTRAGIHRQSGALCAAAAPTTCGGSSVRSADARWRTQSSEVGSATSLAI